MKDGILIRLILGLLPIIAVFVSYILTNDLLIQQMVLLLVYLIGALIYNSTVQPLDWERQYGKELAQWGNSLLLMVCWFLTGFILCFLIWFLSFFSRILITIPIEIEPFPYVADLGLLWVYWILAMVCHCLVEPVAEELYFRCLVGDGKRDTSLFNNYLSALCYALMYFFKYFFTYRESAKVAVWVAILMLIFAIIQGVLIRRGLLLCCAFNIGISSVYPLRLAWTNNVWTKLANPRLFLLYDPKNAWV